jgi:hypothetical protein
VIAVIVASKYTSQRFGLVNIDELQRDIDEMQWVYATRHGN